MKPKTTDFQKLSPKNRAVSASVSPSSLTTVNTKKPTSVSNPVSRNEKATPDPPVTTGNMALVPPPPPESSCPFRQLVFEWLDSVRANGRSPKTLTDYQDKLLKFWWWWTYHTHYAETLGRHPRFVTRKEARAFATYLREPNLTRWGIIQATNNKQREELSPASIAGYGRTVKTFFNWLVQEEHITTTPFTRGVNFSTHSQQDRIVKSVESTDLKRIFNYLMEPHRRKTLSGQRNPQ